MRFVDQGRLLHAWVRPQMVGKGHICFSCSHQHFNTIVWKSLSATTCFETRSYNQQRAKPQVWQIGKLALKTCKTWTFSETVLWWNKLSPSLTFGFVEISQLKRTRKLYKTHGKTWGQAGIESSHGGIWWDHQCKSWRKHRFCPWDATHF